ncbi:hypothetical protein SteCoe_12608 [Stentor coeruleus]|uniref:Uncharacterized protein n=1 Tax=Stentor coeruleus TaxID=5963 RepID=A0A1R2CAE0_9CILI|nr:hypothetical protein SteCoe_12608 [Stentor coeruleus]
MQFYTVKSDELAFASKISEMGSEISERKQNTRKVFSSFEMFKNSTTLEVANIVREIPSHLQGKKISILTKKLENRINYSASLPIEYLESKLFDLSRTYFISLSASNCILSTFFQMHPLLKILEQDTVYSEKSKQLLIQHLSLNLLAIKEYRFIKSFIHFLNDLIIVWGLSNIYNYRFRFDRRLELLYFLNIDDIFEDIISCEVIWLSYAVGISPLSKVVSRNLKIRGEMVQNALKKVFYGFMKCNEEYVKECESIEPWLSYKNPSLAREFNFPTSSKVNMPNYQKLHESFWNVLFSKKCSNLKVYLKNFEKTYRDFEEALLVSFIDMSAACFS